MSHLHMVPSVEQVACHASDRSCVNCECSSVTQAAVDGAGAVLDQLAEINACFGGETVEAILDDLRGHDSDLAREALQSMSR